ncbi:MAG: cytochrome C [Gammaproteobacteria bacterium]|nr:cytochrome C [Gammaproteobacteria bacterium]
MVLRKKVISIGILIFIAGILSAAGFSVALTTTNQTEFCTSCHGMQISLEELKESMHWSNASGVHAGCADCHVPKAFWPKMYAKIYAAKDVYHDILGTIDTKEKYEAYRWKMANAVWEKMKATDSRECRGCHSYDHMNLDEQDRYGRKKHAKAIERGQTCIDCHKGVAHKEPEEPEESESGS